MTTLDPMAQHDIEQEINRLRVRFDGLVDDFAGAANDAAQAEVDYKRTYAEALLAEVGRGGTVAEKEARAVLASVNEFEAWKLAEASFRTIRQALHACEHQSELLRSLNANVRPLVTPPGGEWFGMPR
jgi:hypothetical protein